MITDIFKFDVDPTKFRNLLWVPSSLTSADGTHSGFLNAVVKFTSHTVQKRPKNIYFTVKV
jgi:protein involved in temperature-dependent protein secretion